MGNGNFFESLKQKARALYNNFFYEGEEAPAPRMEETYPPQQMEQQQPYYQQAPQHYQQPYQGYQQSQAYQAAQAYQAPQNPAYQQPAPQQQPFQAPARNRRAQQHAAQQENNVVDFNAVYQQSLYQQPGAAAQQQPSQIANPYQPEAQPQSTGALLSARVINARGMGDCRSAITLLRNGDAVLIVLENVTDPAEMRRLVDTLSGACYSLTATITQVSRYGVYLLAPQTMTVYADQATNQMNGAPVRAQRPMYQPGMSAGQRPMYQPQSVYQQPQQNGGFTQRAAAPEEAAQPFYARTAPQEAQTPAFSTQPAGYGYAPDEAVNQ